MTDIRQPKLVFVVAVGQNGVIGRDGTLPWRLKSDMKHFRAVTMGKPVLMGRKTFESLRKPLPGRTNIVVTRDKSFAAPGTLVAHSLEAALDAAGGDAMRRGIDEIAVIGGADIYRQLAGKADRQVVTLVQLSPAGDVMLPPPDPAVWVETSRRAHAAGPDDEAAFDVAIYDRRKAG